jgi:hypothetical protein
LLESVVGEERGLLEMLAVQCAGCGGDTHLVSRSETSSCQEARRAHYTCPNGFCQRLENVVPDEDMARQYPVVQPQLCEDGATRCDGRQQVVEVKEGNVWK